MAGFLDLPLEIRSFIIQLVIWAERDHPTKYKKNSSRKERARDNMRSWYTTDVWYETDPSAYVTSGYGLLGSNKQLNHETTILLAKIPTVYKIDIGLMQGRMLWPTWTYLPRKTNNVDLIEATFQARGPGKPCFAGWQGGCDSRGPFEWWFYSVLEHFLKFGIRGPPEDSASEGAADIANKPEGKKHVKRSHHVIKTLDLNCIEPDESYMDPDPIEKDINICSTETYHCIHCVRNCRFARHRCENLRAPALNNLLNECIHTLLRMRATMPYAQLLYYTIGRIRFRLNGVLKTEIDLTDWLIKLPDRWERRDISQWRKQSIRFKKAQGFTIPHDVLQTTEQGPLWEEMLASSSRGHEYAKKEMEEEDTFDPAMTG